MQKGPQEVTFKPQAEKLDEFPDNVVGAPRRLKITKRDLENVGYTEGCPQCDHTLRNVAARGGLQHSDRCRTRVMAEVSKTPAGKARVDDAAERITRALVDMSGDVDGGQVPGGDVDGGQVPGGDERKGPDPPFENLQRPMQGPDLVRSNEYAQAALDRWSMPRAPGAEHVNPRDAQIPSGEEPAPDMDMGLVAGDDVCLFLLGQLGSDGKRHGRERKTAYKRLVSEVFSPPRVTAYLSKYPNKDLVPGFALDLTCIDPVDG